MSIAKKAATKPLSAQVARILSLLNDPRQTDEGRSELDEYVTEIMEDAGAFDHPPIYSKMLKFAAETLDAKKSKPKSYKRVQEILARVAAGESLDAIAQEREAELAACAERHQLETLNAPEPKDKLSAEWRHWKLRQIENGWQQCGDAYLIAWDEFDDLFNGLVADPNFRHVDHARSILPKLIIARQEIDRVKLQTRRSNTAAKGARTRNSRKGAAKE